MSDKLLHPINASCSILVKILFSLSRISTCVKLVQPLKIPSCKTEIPFDKLTFVRFLQFQKAFFSTPPSSAPSPLPITESGMLISFIADASNALLFINFKDVGNVALVIPLAANALLPITVKLLHFDKSICCKPLVPKNADCPISVIVVGSVILRIPL